MKENEWWRESEGNDRYRTDKEGSKEQDYCDYLHCKFESRLKGGIDRQPSLSPGISKATSCRMLLAGNCQ